VRSRSAGRRGRAGVAPVSVAAEEDGAMTHDTIADLLLDRLGDDRPGLRTRERDWTWVEVVR
jgi:hypothetical protein